MRGKKGAGEEIGGSAKSIRSFSTLVNELRLEDAQQFRSFSRMSAVQFEQVLDLVKHRIVKKTTKLKILKSILQVNTNL